MHERLPIGEFARRCGLSISALRFYADRGLLPPAEVDAGSGYRSYDEAQVDDAVLIRELRLLGLSLAEVASFLAAAPADRRTLVDTRVADLEHQLDLARDVARALHARLDRSETSMSTTSTITVGSHELRAAIDQVLPAVGTDPDRPMLTGVLVEARDGSLRLVATDSYRMAIRDIPAREDAGTGLRAVVAADDLRSWHARLGGTPGAAGVGVGDGEVVLTLDGSDHRTSSLPDEFPAYEAILTSDPSGQSLVADRAELLGVLERFALQGDAVLLDLDRDRLRLIRREERVELVVRHAGPAAAVALDPGFAAEAIRGAVGPEVVVEIVGSLLPVVIRSADDGTYTALLMPVRLA
ncbi:MAG TPA: MerR family transcriptional regulator [Acidimicrobiales bacterium]